MGDIPIIGQKQGQRESRELRIARAEGVSLQVGRIVMYVFEGTNFRIAAHRLGVEMNGYMPAMTTFGVGAIYRTLARALAHHRHLAMTPVGFPQVLLTEEEVELAIRSSNMDDAATAPPSQEIN